MNNLAILERVLRFTRKENNNGVYWVREGLSFDKVPRFREQDCEMMVLFEVRTWDAAMKAQFDGELCNTWRDRGGGIEYYEPGDFAAAALRVIDDR